MQFGAYLESGQKHYEWRRSERAGSILTGDRIRCMVWKHPRIARRVALTVIVLASSASPSFCGEIHDAAKVGDLVKVKALLSGNPDLVFSKDVKGNTPLYWAALEGHRDVAALLLANRGDANAKSSAGDTPLLGAAYDNYVDVVKLLLAN